MTERTPSPCLDHIQLTKASSLGLSVGEAEHLNACQPCRGQWQALERTRVLLKELPTATLSAERSRVLRDAILVKAPVPRPPRRTARVWLLASASLAACLVVVVLGRGWFAGSPEEKTVATVPVVRGTVAPQGPAVFTRASGQPDELVRVSEGTLEVKVHHLKQGERFRVVTSDAEVEVRGTAFEVRAHDNRLLSVRVSEGLVEVRPTGKPILLLGPGKEWHAQEMPTVEPAVPATAVEPPRPALVATPPARVAYATTPRSTAPRFRVAPEPTPAHQALTTPSPSETPAPSEKPAPSEAPAPVQPQTPTPTPAPTAAVERQFQMGWSALRAHDNKEAARAFAEAASKAGEQPLAEDATFWHAVALERTAHDESARTALAIFIARYPHSPRVGEASVLLGSLLLENGDKVGAATRFRAALADPVERVRAKARAGLQSSERP
jgi:outer membrane biosynthesis protein TonB